MSPSWSNAIGQPLVFKAGGGDKSGYTNYNVTAGAGVGITAGVAVEDSSDKKHFYIGTGLVFRKGVSGSVTHSSSKLTTGYSTAIQLQAILAYQLGHNYGTNIEDFAKDKRLFNFTESGYGLPEGASLTGYWTF